MKEPVPATSHHLERLKGAPFEARDFKRRLFRFWLISIAEADDDYILTWRADSPFMVCCDVMIKADELEDADAVTLARLAQERAALDLRDRALVAELEVAAPVK